MITRLKRQDKLLVTERYEAWESVARNLHTESESNNTYSIVIDRLRKIFRKNW